MSAVIEELDNDAIRVRACGVVATGCSTADAECPCCDCGIVLWVRMPYTLNGSAFVDVLTPFVSDIDAARCMFCERNANGETRL